LLTVVGEWIKYLLIEKGEAAQFAISVSRIRARALAPELALRRAYELGIWRIGDDGYQWCWRSTMGSILLTFETEYSFNLSLLLQLLDESHQSLLNYYPNESPCSLLGHTQITKSQFTKHLHSVFKWRFATN
jgi:hypothetical protein